MPRRFRPRACALVTVSALCACLLAPDAHGIGASPYLPLNLSPEIERKVEQVLILGDQAVQTRPVPISRVLTALPKACERDRVLCRQVRRYLDRYFRSVEVTHASAELGASSRSQLQLPNAHGQRMDSPADASLVAAYRPFNDLLLSAGGVAYGGPGGRFNPDGTLISAGGQYLQVDAGWRDQWLSPMTDSSMLVSTQAPTMPSLTVSSQMPFSPLGLEYQLSVARMSYQDDILWDTAKSTTTAGNPRLASFHLGIAPLAGWAFAGNVVLQYGGGARPESFSNLFSYLFQHASIASSGSANARFANRDVSLTSTYSFPARTPIETYVEFAARDTLHGELYRFHNTGLSAGLHIPELSKRYDLRVELSEWQNSWYTDYVWTEGLVNDGSVIGHWGAAWRDFQNSIGARSAMISLGFPLRTDELNLQYRLLQDAGYAATCTLCGASPPRAYALGQMLTVDYAQPRASYTRGLMLDVGRDEYAAGFVRLAAYARLDGGNGSGAGTGNEDDAADNADDADDAGGEDGQDRGSAASVAGGRLERYVTAGVTRARLGLHLGGFSAASESAPIGYRTHYSPYVGAGLRRAVTARADVGVRADLEDLDGLMVGLRILDYRYRLGHHVAAGGFVGFARYSGPSPAQGYYYGYGLQWRNLWRGWDLSLEERDFNPLQRDKVRASDQAALAQTADPVEWYEAQGTTLSIAHAF
ncbi:MAG TPA: capsule assembly Wzi family protein [Steroidobacteraceae bacterium]|nr:capsule assembly Wzi family protein [Steroidobacteraceae bacterium]